MITEEEKYKAETFKVVGIAMLAPTGAVFLTPNLLYKQLDFVGLIIYIIFSAISFILGCIIIEAGRRFVYKEQVKRKWNQTV